MIQIHKEKVKDIPLLHVVKSGYQEKMLPLVFFIHGFTSAKEHNLHFAYLLAEKGFRVVLPEANLHGERNDGRSNEEIVFEFWDIVTNTIKEIEVVKDDFIARGLVDKERIGLVGTSMGGIITLGSLTQYDWIRAAVCLMGSPNYEGFAREQIEQLQKSGIKLPLSNEELEQEYFRLKKYDLSAQPEALAGRPLLFWHGKKDPVVPFQPTYDFYEKIKKNYARNSADLDFIVDEQADHKVSREALLKTVSWFENHLNQLN
ncbi:esterase [Lederbergia citrea]|uniref:Esterase n=1 Tax=Lederbergia citrea TaxID=2833581 RepID=A0A942Z1B7_9BACI|nr:esterase [Lederbergia citrea]MBS4204092.1 esterase [Lederbergia citrea]MBS4221323.1 esterase [Lederbergia citrea]